MKIKILRRFIVVYCVCVSVFYSSCKKEFVNEGTATSQRSAGDQDLDLLGFGYDAEGNYADENYARGKIIDVEKIRSNFSNRIEVGILSSQGTQENFAENSKTYVENIRKNINVDTKLLLFKSELRSSFTNFDSTDTKYSYASVDKLIIRKKLAVHMDLGEIRENYLTSNFLHDCEIMSPQQIINQYGTHVLTDITLGGKLKVVYRSEINSTDKKNKVHIGLKAGTFKVFGLGIAISGGVDYNESDLIQNKNQSLIYKAIGGDPSINIGGSLNYSQPNPTIDITSWQNSVTLGNSHLISIGQNGLIPIYDLIPGEKGDLVREFYNLSKKGVDFFTRGDLLIYEQINPASFLLMKFPDGFKVIGQSGTHIDSHLFNKSIFNDVSVFGNKNITPFVVDNWLVAHPTYLKTLDDMWQSRLNIDKIIGELNISMMENFNGLVYPFKHFSVDLVKYQTSTYFVRLTEYNKTNSTTNVKISETLYPVRYQDFEKYNFSSLYVKNINDITNVTIGPTF